MTRSLTYLGVMLTLWVLAAGFFLYAVLSFQGIIGNQSNETLNPSQPLPLLSQEESVNERFAVLSNARTSLCSGPDFISLKGSEERLQGSCCSAMDLHRYEEQLQGLQEYAGIEQIPSDPYDVPVSLARELLDYQRTISLSPAQQSTYDEAVQMSHEGGPCCCKCWRWHAFEGLAKYLITDHGFNAEQVAGVWDLEDGCGGTGHAEGMHV